MNLTAGRIPKNHAMRVLAGINAGWGYPTGEKYSRYLNDI
jgi:hypothetical protein